MKMTLYMETTKISAEQTVGEVQRLLGKYGAAGIQLEYQGGEIKAVAFILNINDQRVPFMLPCRWEPLKKILIGRIRTRSIKTQSRMAVEMEAQAKRVAWRQILRWIEAQLALVETNMVKIEEVFLPYLVVDKKGTTLFNQMQSSKFLLEGPK